MHNYRVMVYLLPRDVMSIVKRRQEKDENKYGRYVSDHDVTGRKHGEYLAKYQLQKTHCATSANSVPKLYASFASTCRLHKGGSRYSNGRCSWLFQLLFHLLIDTRDGRILFQNTCCCFDTFSWMEQKKDRLPRRISYGCNFSQSRDLWATS